MVQEEVPRDYEVEEKTYSTYVPKERILDGLVKAEYTILSQMMVSKKAVEIFRKDLGFLNDDGNDLIANMIIEDYEDNGSCNFSRIYDKAQDENVRSILLDLGTIESLAMPFNEDVLRGAINKVILEMKKAQLADLQEQIRINQNINAEETNRILKEYTLLARELGGKENG